MADKHITAIHANDPAWLIALWLRIHGGDPAPDAHGQYSEAAVSAAVASLIRAVAPYLGQGKQHAVTAALGH